MTIKRITKINPGLVRDIKNLIAQMSPDRSVAPRQLKAMVKEKNTFLFGVFDGKRVVGTGTLILIKQVVGTRATIEDVVVDAEYRGKGLGETLMKELLKTAKKHGAEKIILTSRKERVAAHALYKKLGFTIKDTTVFQLEL